jgi:co-chaperonin GroES (HSP10)
MNRRKRNLIVVGDRVLIRPDEGADKTAVGLYLPQTVLDKDAVQSGTVVGTGPGLPLPDPSNLDDEPWKNAPREHHHLPMQAREGDVAVFLRKAAIEIKVDDKTYLVVPQSAILVLLRDED